MMEKVNGTEITNVFMYLQQLFRECQQMIYKADRLMSPEWVCRYGNRITRDVSSSLAEPNKWLIQSIFRVYENDKESNVIKVITITFWGNEVNEPIITAGKIVYSDIQRRSDWDLWDIWFRWADDNEKNDYELDGIVYNFTTQECNYIKEAKVFSCPLVSIENDSELECKIINVLKNL
jgi:hypothetical protein